MIKEVRDEVYNILRNDNSGHGIDHIERVLNLSLNFSNTIKCNKDILSLIALLHDIDDYKLFGIDNEKKHRNAKYILDKCKVSEQYKNVILSELDKIGYSKRIQGKKPTTIEGKIVSDADMCDIIGANGILRIYKYGCKINRPFFDKNIYPNNSDSHYISSGSETGINHFFEKVFKLKNLMFTSEGKREAKLREDLTIYFLSEYFREEDAKEWLDYLNDYLKLNM